MSGIMQDVGNTLADAWAGSGKVWGDMAGMAADGTKGLPYADNIQSLLGVQIPDGDKVKGTVNDYLGTTDDQGSGGILAKAGTILGGGIGLAGGPTGVAAGAGVGSQLGNFLGDLF
jgi:hypothetical protein